MIQDIAPHHLDNVFHPGIRPEEDSLAFVFQGNELLVRREGEDIRLPLLREMEGTGEPVYLFSLDGRRCFWIREASGTQGRAAEDALQAMPQDMTEGADKHPQVNGFAYENLRALRKEGYGPQHLFFAAYTAQQLVSWYRDNAFCGRCAHPTVHSESERALVCPGCGRTIYPRIIPAVIVGVTDPETERIVLTKYAGRDVPYFALVAGFTEIGETLEETVQREVMEEVGLRVKNIRYYKSQPWAMADDILMGFFCDVDGDKTIRLDRNELKEGGWYRREEIVLQPDTYSLTNEMMTMFKEGRI